MSLYEMEVYLSIILVSMPFILRVLHGWKNRVFVTGIVVLVIGKLIEGGTLNIPFPPYWEMYVADPIVLAGSLLLFSRLGGPRIQESKGADRRMLGALFVPFSIFVTVMYAMSYVMQAPHANNWHYVLVSVVWYVAWSAIALSYLEMTNYHPLAFVGAFFTILSMIVCFSFDGFAWAGSISYAAYGAAPWDFMYVTEALGGLFATLALLARFGLHRVNLPVTKMTNAEKALIPAILGAAVIIISTLVSNL